jgi:hypothetical protein
VDKFGSAEEILANLTELIDLKEALPEKIVLLWGNHDLAYLLPGTFFCSDYRAFYARSLLRIFATNFDLFQLAHQEDNWLFSHAGLSKQFWEKTLGQQEPADAGALNRAFSHSPEKFFLVSRYRNGADDYGSPVWADLREFIDEQAALPRTENWLIGFNQVVGHQPVAQKMFYEYAGSKMLWIDTWSHPFYHIIQDDAVWEIRI